MFHLVGQQIPQQIPLADCHHILHRQPRSDDFVKTASADLCHRLPIALGKGFVQICLHHLGKRLRIGLAEQLFAFLGVVLVVNIADQIAQYPITAKAEIGEKIIIIAVFGQEVGKEVQPFLLVCFSAEEMTPNCSGCVA